MPRKTAKTKSAPLSRPVALVQQGYGWIVVSTNPWQPWPAAPPRPLPAAQKIPFETRTYHLLHSTGVNRKRLTKVFRGLAALRADHLDLVEALIEKLQADAAMDVRAVPPAPALPPERYSQRRDRAESAPAFVKRVYGTFLDGHYFTVATLRKLDPPAAAAVIKYRMMHGWPRDVELPTLPEANERLIARGRIAELRERMKHQDVLTRDELLELRRLEAVRSKIRQRSPD